ncbi:hypothetical protein OAJ57_03390 [Alphaproteobacteria bacterium]|nr:hypothetical protein [Alphaproteobacteria bacterium]
MARNSSNPTAEQIHCDAFVRENADLGIRRPASIPTETPLDRLATQQTSIDLTNYSPNTYFVRRSSVTLTTRSTSFDVWAALSCLEDLLSDYRRLAPRYSFLQTAGEATVAVGNEYRLTLSDFDIIKRLNIACRKLAAAEEDPNPIEQRVMDIRIVRAGPWGGETGELVVEALRNHALAGASSLWVLAHDDSDDGSLRVTLDAFEIGRWAWAPDFLANQQNPGDSTGARIIDWNYLFERLAEALDGIPEATDAVTAFFITQTSDVIAQDERVKEALRIHCGLKPFFDRIL